MTRQPDDAPPRAKKGGSFVWKITLRETLRTIGLFFWTDLLIILLFWGGVAAGVERIAPALLRGAGGFGAARSAADVFFTVSSGHDSLAELSIPSELTDRFGLLPGSRGLRVTGPASQLYLSGDSLRYVILTRTDRGDPVVITFTPGILLQGFIGCFLVIVAFQGLCLLSGIFKISGSVRNILRPIDRLTIATHQSMTAQAAQPVRKGELQLGSAIDAINAINENRLDTRIDVNKEREELRGLAVAINSMLDRVDFAYRSQLRFVSDAPHELRTPISVIQGYASLLDRWGKADQKTLDESIAAIRQEADGMKKLVEQLLFLARSDNDSIAIRIEDIDLSALLHEVARDTEIIELKSGHNVVCPDFPPVHIRGDVQLLKQALRILMDNALKYTPDGGEVKLDVRVEEGMAALSVTDSGIGIGPEDLPKLFDRFYRTDASRARQTGGSGLGLSIARWIVDSHGGSIDVLSREGLGTRVTIRLALARPDGAANAEALAL